MHIQEFPRMLFRGDDQVIVNDADEQAKMIGTGFMRYEAWRSGEVPKTRTKPATKPKPKAD
jgi:hypothetical protein